MANNLFNPIFDNNFKKMILKYQNSNSLNDYREILNITSDYIYNYPRLKFKLSLDDCSDFYLYFIKKYPVLIKKYEVQKYLFVTWFNKVLRNTLVNWLKKNNMKNESPDILINTMEFFDKYTSNSVQNETEDTYYVLKVVENQNTFITGTKIRKILSKFPFKLQYILKLFFFEIIHPKDLVRISTIFNSPLNKVLLGYKILHKSILSKLVKKQLLYDKINKIHLKIEKKRKNYKMNIIHLMKILLNLKSPFLKWKRLIKVILKK